MKKLLSIITVLSLSLTVFGISAAADIQINPVKVYVTIADKDGRLAVSQQEITVSDIDDDGLLTINDALYAAHEEKFTGGAAAGYATEVGDYGLSLSKLWGVANGGSYGYLVNNKFAWGLTDTVKEGDYINAFIYTDTDTWSDAYTYFNVNTVAANAGDDISVTLYKAGYDANYNQIEIPVAGAQVLVNGKKIDAKTDAAGKVSFKINKEGTYTVSAASDSERLVPSALKVTITGNVEEPAEVETQTETSPKTGDNVNLALWAELMIIGLAVIVLAAAANKTANEQ